MPKLGSVRTKLGAAAKAASEHAAVFAKAAGNILSIPAKISSLTILILASVIIAPGPHWFEFFLAIAIWLIAFTKLVKG